MLDFTPISRQFFAHRLQEIKRFTEYSESVQRDVLATLLGCASYTEYGQKYRFPSIRGYNDFSHTLPLTTYEDLKPHIQRMIRGEKSILWPGRVDKFAQSSGTSDGKSKYIPITNDALKKNHYQGASDVVALYLNMNPDSRIFSGKAFILGGSFANEVDYAAPGTQIGDLSATLINNINPMVNMMRVPNKHIALMPNWDEKLPALVEASKGQNITNLSGVPSWFLTVIREVMKSKGASSIHEVWPNLEVFFHGGISFDPYREQYQSITDHSKMHFVETYNASEGFFATQSSFDTNAMLLLLDIGIFYEFIPLDQIDDEHPTVLPIWEISEGETYALVITSCNGLWRYKIGDTVRVESTTPLKIRIAGRTKSYINAFGEELMVHNANAAITYACAVTSAQIIDFTAAPVYTTEQSKGHHQWLIEFAKMPSSLKAFTEALDSQLQHENSDYEAKRQNGIFLAAPDVVVAKSGLFDTWLGMTGKRGGQRKVPRLCNDRKIMNQLLELNENTNQ